MKIAVVGSGIAGLGAAYLLSKEHEVELFEQDDRLGGHSHTHRIEQNGAPVFLDSAFMIYNKNNYPNFFRLLGELGIEGCPTDMSFSVRCRRCGLEYSNNGVSGFWAQPSSLLKRHHWLLLWGIFKFFRKAKAFVNDPTTDDDKMSLRQFIKRSGLSDEVTNHFIMPIGCAIWSSSSENLFQFPARSYLEFFSRHGILSRFRVPQWYTIPGGCKRYVDEIARVVGEQNIHLNSKIEAVWRLGHGIKIGIAGKDPAFFDKIILAAHANDALKILADSSQQEREVLGAFSYSDHDAKLHGDTTLLPQRKSARASWNCDLVDCKDETTLVGVTYHLNRLQNIESSQDFCVSLNRDISPGASLFRKMSYSTPIINRSAKKGQERLSEISGVRDTYFCGAHWGYGFHEDGLKSAIQVASQLGTKW